MKASRQMTREEVLALPPVVDLPTLGRALGLSEPVIRERARLGELEPLGIRVLRLGWQYRVPSEDILRLLGITRESRTAGPETPDPAASNGTIPAAKQGRHHDDTAADCR